jgi:hypothetical protein
MGATDNDMNGAVSQWRVIGNASGFNRIGPKPAEAHRAADVAALRWLSVNATANTDGMRSSMREAGSTLISLSPDSIPSIAFTACSASDFRGGREV